MFVISIEQYVTNTTASALCRVLSTYSVNSAKIHLIKWRPLQTTSGTTVLTVRSELELSNLPSTWMKLPQKHKIIVISPYPTVPGLKDFLKDRKKDLDRNEIHLIMSSGIEKLDHIPDLELTYNVLKNVKQIHKLYKLVTERV